MFVVGSPAVFAHLNGSSARSRGDEIRRKAVGTPERETSALPPHQHYPLAHLTAIQHHPLRGRNAFSQITERLAEFFVQLYPPWLAIIQFSSAWDRTIRGPPGFDRGLSDGIVRSAG